MKKQTVIFFYVIVFYIIVQFLWWGYHLIQITEKLHSYDHSYKSVNGKILMIVGEGMVFLVLLLFSFWRIYISIKKDKKLTDQQNNFLLSVTHELKTPIAAIKLYLQTLVKREFPEEKKKELLQKTLLENENLENIVESILTATRLEGRTYVVHNERIDVRYLVSDIVDRFNHTTQENWIQFETNTTEPIYLNADTVMIRTIVNNLIHNAIKYCPAGTEIYAYAFAEKGKVMIGVKDLGPGVKSEAKEDLFKKFVRGEDEETRSQKGTGLGLFIAAEFSRINRGKLSYSNNVPNGSVFDVTFLLDKF